MPRRLRAIALLMIAGLATDPAFAYIGPGVGIAALSAVLGVLGSIVLGIASVIYYPIKRLLKRMKKRPDDPAP